MFVFSSIRHISRKPLLDGESDCPLVSTATVETGSKIRQNVILLQFLWGCSYGCYIFLYGAWFIQQLGFGDAHKGVVLASVLLILRQGLNALLDIPLGVLADKVGRLTLVRFAFVAKLLFHGTLASLVLVSSKYPPMVPGAISSILFALAYTSFSGAFSAWVVDESPYERVDPYPVLAAGYYAFFMGELLTGVVSVLLFFWKPAACFLLGGGFCAVAEAWAVFRCREHRSKPRVQKQVGQKYDERFQAIRKLLREGRTVLAVMLIFGCFMFLLNFVELYWPQRVRTYTGGIGPLGPKGIWMAAVFVVCVLRLAGSRLFKNWLNVMKSIPIGLKIRRVRPLFFSCGLGAAAVAIVTGLFTHVRSGSDPLFPGLFVVLLLVFMHGLFQPLSDVLVNAIMPAGLDDHRAAVLSVSTTIRSILLAIFAIPAAEAFSDRWEWALPGGVLLIATLGSLAFVARPKSPWAQAQSK